VASVGPQTGLRHRIRPSAGGKFAVIWKRRGGCMTAERLPPRVARDDAAVIRATACEEILILNRGIGICFSLQRNSSPAIEKSVVADFKQS